MDNEENRDLSCRIGLALCRLVSPCAAWPSAGLGAGAGAGALRATRHAILLVDGLL